MKDCELFAPSALIQSCDRTSANSYALYSNREGTAGLIYSNREGTAGLIYSNREGTAAWFTAVVRELRFDLQQS